MRTLGAVPSTPPALMPMVCAVIDVGQYRNKFVRGCLTLGWATSLLVSGCSEPHDGVDPGPLEALAMQPARRFPAGATFYLPRPEEGRWVITEAPEGNANELFVGEDGYVRLTPVLPGEYAFVVEGTEERRTLTVVEQTPFEHYNYYGTTTVARVGEEIWVANTFDPHLSRVDPASGAVLGTVRVGPWPVALAHVEGSGQVLVAHKAGDTLGFVDVADKRIVDAVWVGDEPADIVVAPDGLTAFVSLATDDAVAVVDLRTHEVVERIAVNVNPTSMALSEDGATLYVASYRSGVQDRQQFAPEPRNDQFDIVVVDVEAAEVTGAIEAVGSTIGGLRLVGDTLYVSTTRVALEELSNAPGMTAFRHTVAAYDVASRTERAAVDLGRQESSTGLAVRPFGLDLVGGTLWVANEGSDLAVGLDPNTLAEVGRFEAAGRPRTIYADGDRVIVHGAQAYRLTMASSDGTVTGTVDLAGDPRNPVLALGQRLYTGTGAGAGENHSCADCHVDGLTDGNVWSAGGFSESASRPMFWMEGTYPIGWEGDANDLFSYLYGSPGPTIGATLTNEVHDAFYAYLAALVPPPPANGLTARDGALTEDGQVGKALFEGAGACGNCHSGPLTTDGLRLPGGGTQDDHPIVVPSLVGAYRHTFWLVNGAARTLEEAVRAMLPLSNVTLSDDEVAAVARYLAELTPRELFVLASEPRRGVANAPSEGPLTITMSHAVFDDPENLARVGLRDDAGATVPVDVEADGRHLTLTPAQALVPGARYELFVGEGFEGFNELSMAAEQALSFTVAEAPGLTLEGDYVITVEHPNLDFENLQYDPSVIIPIDLRMTATPTAWGARLDTQVTESLTAQYDVVVADDVAHFPPFAFPVGPGFLNRSFPSQITLTDDDGDGVADSGESTLFFRSPGLEATDVRWVLARDTGEPSDCAGQEGTHELDLMLDDEGLPTIDWPPEVGALGMYVTDPEAMPPAGPGPVTGGETFWALATAAFPTGFSGPVRYGETPEGATDVSADSGAPEGGASLAPGVCVKVSVVFDDFSTSTLRYETPN